MQDNVLASTLVESSGIWIQGDISAASSAHSLQFHIVLQTFIGEEGGGYVEAEVWRENFQPIFISWVFPLLENKELKVERIDETGAFSVSFLSHESVPFVENKELKVERIDEKSTGAFSASFNLMSLSLYGEEGIESRADWWEVDKSIIRQFLSNESVSFVENKELKVELTVLMRSRQEHFQPVLISWVCPFLEKKEL